MRKIPKELRDKLSSLPEFSSCSRKSRHCWGRITWEHCWIYAGKQINEEWAIIPLCWRHHLGDMFNKEINQWISINKATASDLAKYPKRDWKHVKKYLNKKYGRNDWEI